MLAGQDHNLAPEMPGRGLADAEAVTPKASTTSSPANPMSFLRISRLLPPVNGCASYGVAGRPAPAARYPWSWRVSATTGRRPGDSDATQASYSSAPSAWKPAATASR
jgi:hypothetical protein